MGKKARRQSDMLRVRQIVLPIERVQILNEPPGFARPHKRTKAQARGISYEHKVAKELQAQLKEGDLCGELIVGPWFDFVDANGPGLAQPDIVLLTENTCLIFECKLKQSERAHYQLEGLYGPLANALWAKPKTLLLQVFKFPKCGRTSRWVESPTNLLAKPRAGVHHWHLFT